MRFCVFLVEEGAISEQECVEVLRILCQRTPLMGRLIVKMRMLSLAQLRTLIDKQGKIGGPLGKIAVAEGLLTELQLGQLLERQRSEAPNPLDIVAELGFVEAAALHTLHRKFLATLE